MKRLRLYLACALIAACSTMTAFAQANFPSKPVRWVLPFNAGGPADLVARTIAQQLEKKWGQSVVVDNKPGGNGVIAALDVIKATPDGHTLFQPLDSMLTMNQFLYSKQPYDSIKDFTHITQLASLYPFLLARKGLEAKGIDELVVYARANPGKVTIGYPAQSSQVIGEEISRAMGVQFTPVPYKSGIEMVKGLLGDEIDLGIEGGPAAVGYVESGKLRALAAVSAKRSTGLPSVPTLKEQGVDSAGIIWHGLSGPAGMSEALRTKIQSDVRDVLAMPEVKARLSAAGLEAVGSTSQQYESLIRSDSDRNGPIIKRLGMKVN